MDSHQEEKGQATNAGDMKYPHNVLEGFSNGCILDLRMRFAMELLTGGALNSSIGDGAFSDAEYALDLSSELFNQAEKRGWIAPLPDDGELNRMVRMQAKRTALFQALQQMEGQKAMQRENASSIIEPSGKH